MQPEFPCIYLHDSADAVVTARTRVDVAVLELMGVAAVSFGSASCVLSGVAVAIGVDSGCVVAAIRIEVEERLELELKLGGTLGESRDDVSSLAGRRRGLDSG